MTLSEYMELHDLTDGDVADAIGVSRVSVLRYRRGDQRPDWEQAARIVEWSEGAVPLESWPKTEAAE
jgi:putative transcriptional regulator